jgi:hypothetical protein
LDKKVIAWRKYVYLAVFRKTAKFPIANQIKMQARLVQMDKRSFVVWKIRDKLEIMEMSVINFRKGVYLAVFTKLLNFPLQIK